MRKGHDAAPFEELERRVLLSLTMVKDINPGTFPTGNIVPGTYGRGVEFRGNFYFPHHDGTSGMELWRTDGTPGGTAMVVDLVADNNSYGPTALTAVGDALYFGMGTGGALWKTDGTAAGTTLVARPTPNSTTGVEQIYAFDGKIYFIVGSVLYVTDGVSPPVLLGGGLDSSPRSLVGVGDTVYFAANRDPQIRMELYKTDGTPGGTTLVKELAPGRAGDNGSSHPRNLTEVDGKLYFTAVTGDSSAASLWSTDGTAAGTQQIVTTPPFPSAGPDHLLAFDGDLFFVHDYQLWRTDGTADGRTVVSDAPVVPHTLTVAGDRLFFFAHGDAGTYTLWCSDGTPAGTVPIKTGFGPEASVNYSPHHARGVADSIYFIGGGGSAGVELWRSDGTPDGTRMVVDLNPGPGNSSPTFIDTWGERLVFVAFDDKPGLPLWVTDGTAAGTTPLRRTFAGSNPSPVLRVGDVSYVSANDGAGTTLWRTDGTGAGTYKVEGPATLGRSFTRVGDRVFFVMGEAGELWVADLQLANAKLVKDIYPGPTGSDARNLTALGQTLYFTADDGVNRWEVWKSDGTPEGTVMLKDIVPEPPSAAERPFGLTPFKGELYFAARDAEHGTELWKTDGTPEGTVLLKDIQPGPGDSLTQVGYATNPYPGLVEAGGLLYFWAADAPFNRELWCTDGTPAGTRLVKDLSPASQPSLYEMTAVGGVLYLLAGTSLGNGIWRSDGTASGTQLVKLSINFRGAAIFPHGLKAVGNTLYFFQNEPATGAELWKSDGTAAGTGIVKDLFPGPADGAWFGYGWNLTAGPDGQAYFRGYDPERGAALWKSDGTAAGTVPLPDPYPGPGSAGPGPMWFAGNRLYFSATDGVHGLELWSLDTTIQRRPGDANGDSVVNFSDLVVLAQNYLGTGKSYEQGDFTGDGTVDFADLVVLAQNYNEAPSASATASRPARNDVFSIQPVRRKAPPKRPAPVARPRFR